MIRALALFLIAAAAPQQAPPRDANTPTGTASIAGVVIAVGDKQPIGYARVTLNSGTRITYTNAKGEFLFPKLPAGPYSISVQASGYLGMSLGQLRPGRPGVAQVLAAGEERKGVILAMHKGGIVSGHVVGPDGRPLADVNVGALRKTWASDGSPVFSWNGQGKTDDRGDFRISGLITGSYLVEAVPPGIFGRDRSLPIDDAQRLVTEGMIQTFYPGTIDPVSAVPIAVDVDTERAGIDFNIQPTPLRTVSGRVDGVVAVPMLTRTETGSRNLTGGSVRLVPPPQAAGATLADNVGRGPFASVGADGRFRFEAVPAGEYELQYQGGSAQAENAPTPPAYGIANVTVADRDVEDAIVSAHTGANIRGEISSGGAKGNLVSPPDFGLIHLSASWNGGTFIPARVDTSGHFAINGLPPGRYAFRPAASAAGVYLFSVEIDGAPIVGTLVDVGTSDLTNLRLTFRTDVAEISGTVRHEDLSPVTEYALVVFPADKREWPIWMSGAGVTRADSAGHYKYAVKPGVYLIAAVEDVDQFQWLDPGFLESLIPTATKMTMGPSQKLTQDFVVK